MTNFYIFPCGKGGDGYRIHFKVRGFADDLDEKTKKFLP